MSKYRLSYLENGGYKSIDLSKLECLKDKVVTDIKTIDELTMLFRTNDDFMLFLKRNEIINDTSIKLEITIDKKVGSTNNTYNKPIYNSHKLLFGNDEELLKYSFILKNIREHFLDGNYMYNLALNFEEKYQNAYNRINGSSFILWIITNIKVIALKLLNNEPISYDMMHEYEENINKLYQIELYKYDTVKENGRTVNVKRKKDENGKFLKNYRGAHDFVNLLKELDPTIIKEIEEDEKEEFLVLNEDFRNVNEELVYSHNFDKETYIDGHDCHKDFTSRQEMFAELQRGSRKYCLKKGDGRI